MDADSRSVMFASPLDFLLNALVVAGLVVLAVSSFAMWRAAHRPGIGVVVVDRPSTAALFYAVQLAAGFAVAALVMAYEWFLRTHVSQTPVDIVRFSLDRLDPIAPAGDRRPDRAQCGGRRPRGPALSAGVVAVGVSGSPSPVARARDCRVAAAGVVFFGVLAADDRAPQWPSVLVVAVRRGGGVADASLSIRRSHTARRR